jgi:hypothetical protein
MLKRHYIIGLILFISVFTGACLGFLGSGGAVPQFLNPSRSIREVRTQQAVGTTVYLNGQVGDRVPLVNGMIYQLQDNTGSIWILTTNTMLQSGQTVSVEGQVYYQSIPLAGQEQGDFYIQEQKRQ